jgi:hypothetical protein
MNPNRRLSLKREALTRLSADDLTLVQGAAQALSDGHGNCTLDDSWRVCSLFCQYTVNTCG